MPQIPDRDNLGPVRVNGRANPASINPNVALDIGRAGAAMDRAMDQVASGFIALDAKKRAMDDATWLSNAKIKTLEADDAIRRNTELNAGEDGTGFEQAPMQLKTAVDDVKKIPGGSEEARQRYDLWSAEQGYGTGKWAADSAQKRLHDTTLTKLDARLDTLSSLSSANPERANEYLSAYEEEINGYVGSAITADDARKRIDQARSGILKSSIVARAIKNPSDFGKALKAIENSGGVKTSQTEKGGGANIASLTFELETGKKDPFEGVANISKDAKGSKSYGNFGINSGGSAQQFQKQYGAQFGLTAKPGTQAFDDQWKNAAGAAPQELHAAEMEWWESNIGSKVVSGLTSVGVPSDMANDPRVKAYFADRMVQYGPESNAVYSGRIRSAIDVAKGDVDKFLDNMTKQDKGRLGQDFRSALAGGTASQDGLEKRIRERRSGAAGFTGDGTPTPAVDLRDFPKVEGTIQPAELAKLGIEDQARVVKELAPHLQVEMQERINGAIASLTSKGSQDIITDQQIDDAAPIIGAKNAQKWKEALVEAKVAHDVTKLATTMSKPEREAELRRIVPTGNPEDLAGAERTRFDYWVGAMKVIDKGMREDPLRWLSQNNESGRQATKLIAGAGNNADGLRTRERAYDTLIELQRREGISGGDIKILNPEDAQKAVETLRNAKTGPAATNFLDGMRATYGKHFDRVWGELVDHGAPQGFMALGTATRQGQDALVSTYAMENAIKEGGSGGKKDVFMERAGAKRSELNQAVTNKLTGFLQGLDGGAQSGKLQEAYRNAVERTALYYMTQGKTVGDAVDSAAADIYGKNVEVVGKTLIPRAVYDQNGGEITRTLNSDYKKLLEPYRNEIVSRIRVQPGRGLSPGHEERRYVDNVMNSPKFITKEDGSGVYVLDELGNYVMTRQNTGMAPLSFSWDALAKTPRPIGYNRTRFD